jgi:hypothetical protein
VPFGGKIMKRGREKGKHLKEKERKRRLRREKLSKSN